jgi:preprotein translocase subunit SecA
MSSSILNRPGLLAGVYPQREEFRPTLLEKIAAGASGFVHQHALGRQPRFRRFVRAVDKQAAGLDRISDEDLAAKTQTLRRSLYALGLRDDLVIEAFAIIREFAARRMGLRHYDVQLFGGWVMLQGRVAEMETGEGKTLTATLAAATAALADIPVHIVTVNDFLAARDAQWMTPLYHALGLSVGVVTGGMDAGQRRTAYSRNITYCTNKQLVFDYLSDRMVLGRENRSLHLNLEELYAKTPRTGRLLLRGLCFAIVDEVDSVLVDEARTPLIISSRTSIEDQEQSYRHALRIAQALESPRDFQILSAQTQVDLTDLGKARIARMARGIGGVWSGVKRREELTRQALTAMHLFKRDKDYLVRDGSVQIIDEYTGRVMADRSWERGLHQMIEVKEGCRITGRQETLSRISYQRFFQRYLRLAGMTGTAREVASELWSVYRLKVVSIPTNEPTRRTFLGDRLYLQSDQRWQAVADRLIELHKARRPVLVGTRSVSASEHLSKRLNDAGLPHRVLNARQNQREAEIISQAGHAGLVTVATNMAGRGTDIRLSPGVAELGGLHVLATERHEARRIDRQLSGRAGRQGDPGSFEVIASIEDELFRDAFGPRFLEYVVRVHRGRELVTPGLARILIILAQSRAERRHRRLRKDLLRVDENLGDLLAFTGRGE